MYKQAHPYSDEYPDSAFQHTLPSIHWTGLILFLQYQSMTNIAIENNW